MRYLFLLFIILPVLEISLLIKVGSVIGVVPTVALILCTAFAGAYLLKRQGVHTLFRINQRMAAGEVPAREMMEGVVLALGGALLLAPGFITDAMGLVCVMPGTRRLMVQSLIRRILVMPTVQPVDPYASRYDPPRDRIHPQDQSSARRSETIEGEFHRDDQ